MQSNRFLVHVLVFVVLIWHVSAYYEKRTFRERSKISCRKHRIVFGWIFKLFIAILNQFHLRPLGLQKTCKTFDGQDDQYRMMMPLANLLDSQPKNYLLRFPFYILAESNAYIAFSETENPDWLVDDVYEFGKKRRTNCIAFRSNRLSYARIVFGYSVWHLGEQTDGDIT